VSSKIKENNLRHHSNTHLLSIVSLGVDVIEIEVIQVVNQ